MIRSIFIAGAAVLFGLLNACGASDSASNGGRDGVQTIRMETFFAAGNIVVEAADRFASLVQERSAGRLRVIVAIGGTENEINDRVTAGRIEMHATGGRPIEAGAPRYFFFNGPYVMKDFDHFMRVWNGRLGREARAEIARNGNQLPLGIVWRGMRQLTANRPINSPSDLAGLSLRLPPIPTWNVVWQAMGASTVEIGLAGLYEGLRTGMANASEGDLTQIASAKLYDVQTHLMLTKHLVQTGGLWINKTFFETLPADQQALLVTASRDAIEWANERLKGLEGPLLETMRRRGMQIVNPDAEAFRAAAKPAVEALFQTEWTAVTWAELLAL